MRFGEYLISRGKIKQEALVDALIKQHGKQAKLGAIALRHRFLSVRQVMDILLAQAHHRIPILESGHARFFGELAIELGFLTPEQVERMMVLQLNSRPPIGILLVQMGALSESDLEPLLEDFQENKVICD